MPMEKPSLSLPAGTPALASSSATTVRSASVRPPPPYSVGQATASSPASDSVWRHPAMNALRSSTVNAPMPCQSLGSFSARKAWIFCRNASASGV